MSQDATTAARHAPRRRALQAFAGLLVLASALHFLGGQVADPDLWQHLRFGSILWNDEFPRFDAFSYTAYGAPLVNHEWLAQWLFAGAYAAGGSAGLIALKLAVAALLVVAWLDTARVLRSELGAPRPDAGDSTMHPVVCAAVLVLVLAVVGPGATFRPQLFTIALLALQSDLLSRADARLRRAGPDERAIGWELAAQPPLLAAWANLHGGYVVGVGMLGVFAAVVALRAIAARLAASPPPGGTVRAAAVLGIALAGVAAPLANPYGSELYSFLFRTLHVHDEISEWYPVPLLSPEFGRFKILVLATGAAIALLWRMRSALPGAVALIDWRGPFLALAAFYAFRHQRHTVLFAVAAAPLLLVAADLAARLALERFPGLRLRRPVLAAAAAGAAFVAGFQIHGYAAMLSEQGLSIRYGRLDFPADAVEFLRSNGITGNVAMPFEWGSYAIWKLAPESRVFIDGRFETVYPERVIDDYFAFMHGAEGWERLIDDYPTDVIVVQRWRDIHPRLFARKDLVYVYSDPAALVFVRPSPRNAEALAHLAKLADRAAFAPPETVFP